MLDEINISFFLYYLYSKNFFCDTCLRIYARTRLEKHKEIYVRYFFPNGSINFIYAPPPPLQYQNT